jgi:hypothetical protein
MKKITSMLVTGGEKITCRRCTALSKRSGEQCKKPALKSSRTQKCEFHGGRSTGPKTEAGKARQRAAVIKTGDYTKEAIEDKARSLRVLAGLEDAMYVLNMTTMPRTQDRNPKGYVPLITVEDVARFALDNPLHSPRALDERQKKYHSMTHGPLLF